MKKKQTREMLNGLFEKLTPIFADNKLTAYSYKINNRTAAYTYDSNDRLIASSDGFEYYYDQTGVFAIKYNGEKYVFQRDMLGNVIAILDNTGAAVVKYTYDAWGNHTISGTEATTIGVLNPIRYRGYFFDTETGLYFLQTRYYDPEVGRFITIDSVTYADPETVNGLNLYAYCGNNPVMYSDPSGTFALTLILITMLAGGIILGTASGVNAYQNGARGWDLVGDIAYGASIGIITGFVVGVGAAAIGVGAGIIGGGGMFALAGGGTAGGAAALVGAGVMVAGGAIVVNGVAVGTNIMFLKGNGPRLGHNQYENKQFDQACKKYNLNYKQRRILHDIISHQNLNYKQIVELIKELFFGG